MLAPNSLPSSRAVAEMNSPTFLGSLCCAASPACDEKNWPTHDELVGAAASAGDAVPGSNSPTAVTKDHVMIRAPTTVQTTISSSQPHVTATLSKLTVTSPLAFKVKCAVSWTWMVLPSEPLTAMVSVNVLLLLRSFRLKLPQKVA